MICAFYGSLRKGHYNYNGLLKNKEGVKYLSTETIPRGFVLHSLGSYPMVMESKDSSNPLVVDLFEITNDRVLGYIDGMERGAGYKDITIKIADMDCKLWVGSEGEKKYLNECPIVTSGDWSLEKLGHK